MFFHHQQGWNQSNDLAEILPVYFSSAVANSLVFQVLLCAFMKIVFQISASYQECCCMVKGRGKCYFQI